MRVLRAVGPPSIGNVAAGFDVVGAALAPVGEGAPWGDVVELREAQAFSLRCEGPYAHRLPPAPEHNLVLHARWLFEEAVKERAAPLAHAAVTLHKQLPVNSGLGSSSASIVAALTAFNAWCGAPLSALQLLPLAGRAEGIYSGAEHYDNVAPALLGGLRLLTPQGEARALPLPAGLRFVMALPELELATAASRAALPARFPLGEVVAHAQNLATWVHALHTGDLALLGRTTKDLLAEPHRAGLVRGFAQVKAAALAAGALGCSLSGSGPAVFALAQEERAAPLASAMQEAFAGEGVACTTRVCRLDAVGARVLP